MKKQKLEDGAVIVMRVKVHEDCMNTIEAA